MIRIVTVIAGIALAVPALAQIAEPTLLSPARLTEAAWGTRAPAKKAARFAQDVSAPAPVTAPAPQPVPAPQPAPTPHGTGQNLGAPALKAAALVTSEIVRIGDLVENAGAVADVAIFRAPDLGQTGSVPASSVVDAVRPHHIIGLATNGIETVTVTRASRTITAKQLEARLLRAIAGQHGLADAKDLGATFDNEPRAVHVEANVNADVNVVRLAFDPRTRRFDVVFELPGSTAARRLPLRFTGVVTETTEAVVVTRAVAQGAVFKDSDVMIERRPKAEFAGAPVPTIEDVLGFAARRSLQPGKVIRHADLMKPELVGRNETVTIVYEVPGIVLTVRGKAMEPGAKGDLINVLNIQSQRKVQATVTGPGRVTVGSFNARLAANVAAATDSSNPPSKPAQ
jgi:flagella basal body P-ring formation protein FlgA